MINTVTLNPAIDKVFFLSELRKNVTNRVQCVQEVIGGKGTHVSINLKLMGISNRAYGICHGATGRRIMDMLGDYEVESRFLWQDGANSRTNYLLVEDSCDCTLIAERGVDLQDSDLAGLSDAIAREVKPDDFLVLSGDTSNCNPSVYSHLMRRVQSKGVKVFLDTSGDALADCIRQKPWLVKPNLDELSALCGKPIAEDDASVIAAADALAPYEIEVIAVSLGGAGSIVRLRNGDIYRALPPRVNVVNTIGCGDCFLAGLLRGFSEDLSMEDTLRCATGVSAATAESPSSVGFDPVRARELTAEVRIDRLR